MWVMDGGQILEEVDNWSRAFQFGDGLFETMAIENGLCPALPLHVARLQHGLKVLEIQYPQKDLKSMLLYIIEKMLNISNLRDGVLKIIVSRANSERGYGFDKSLKSVVTAFFTEKAEYPESYFDNGVSLKSVETLCSIQPQLAGLKHLNRLENVMAKNELGQKYFEGMMCNYLGYVIEGSMSNLFFGKGRKLYTPDLSISGVSGIMRRLILEYCTKKKISVSVENITQADIGQYDGAFICNSLMGAMPVQSIDNLEFTITPLIKEIMEAVRSGKIYE